MGNNIPRSLNNSTLVKNQWRPLEWKDQTRYELIETIREYKPLDQVGVQQARILLLGHTNVGKSSFFNTINSIFRNHVTAQAVVGSPDDQRTVTTKMRSYQVRDGREGKVLNFEIVDTMGVEGNNGEGFDPAELPYILDGHVPDNHQFDSKGNISADMHGFKKSPGLKEKIHCCVFVLDATRIENMDEGLKRKLSEMRKKITSRGIPLLVLVSKIDQVCSHTLRDIALVYRSAKVQQLIAQASLKIGIPVCHILPIKNYTHEIELDTCVDILSLSALQQMLRFTDNYFDESLVTLGKGYVQPSQSSNDAWTKSATRNPTPSPKLNGGAVIRPDSEIKMAWVNGNNLTVPSQENEKVPINAEKDLPNQVVDIEVEKENTDKSKTVKIADIPPVSADNTS